ncbi:MAG: methyltransferase domain-containing protein [Candidatus Zixiibacteriota bacterium]
MKPYNKFANVYDEMGADHHSIKMTEYCFKIFRKFHIRPTTGLDLCCGTGSAILKFAEKGIMMSGLDQSASMLAMAARKLKDYKVRLYQKSLPRFRLLDTSHSRKIVQFDLVTSFYDSLNYLKNQTELKTAFKSVYAHLLPGGWFIFDMNTPPALKILWGGQIYAGLTDNMGWVWQNDYNPKTKSAICRTTFFQKKGELYERFEEVHVEKAYENAVIKKVLKTAGFQVKGFYRCHSFEKPRKGTYRICVVAKKPA